MQSTKSKIKYNKPVMDMVTMATDIIMVIITAIITVTMDTVLARQKLKTDN
jgi:hypothetical protein